ncbi:hypothetical protein RND81_06G175100 [Saponaria officinalis]|uniref:Zinc finger GRF-type domain-containing protein n=1 Tax=Saponaria officinalis TaxID=3572 RepID=A0AAW1KCZ7_SAPOF
MSSSSWRNEPIEGLEFVNQPCRRCRRNAVIGISRSTSNPRKAYFRCEECNIFVGWLIDNHVIFSKTVDLKCSFDGDVSSVVEERSEDAQKLKMDLVELANVLRFYVTLIAFVFTVLVVAFIVKM